MARRKTPRELTSACRRLEAISNLLIILAERVRFELTNGLPRCRFSSLALRIIAHQSHTQTPPFPDWRSPSFSGFSVPRSRSATQGATRTRRSWASCQGLVCPQNGQDARALWGLWVNASRPPGDSLPALSFGGSPTKPRDPASLRMYRTFRHSPQTRHRCGR
jgi:hypothetical protein